MRHPKITSCALVALLCALVVTGCLTAKKNSPTVASAPAPATGLSPGSNDGRIAYVAARLMEVYHYSHHPLDTDLSEKFFDGYLDSLDPRHENFLQSDIAEFAHYRTNLDTLTIGSRTTAGHDTADLTPAYEIFRRFLERLQQHDAYVDELLKQDKFKFTTDERILLDRRHAPYPRDLDEAHQLWGQWLRHEYLMEKLSREISPTNNSEILPLSKSADTNIIDALERHNRWNLRMTTNLDSDFVLQAYLNALVHAYDPHSDFFTAPKAQDFSINMSLSLFGIGASLTEDDGYCTISKLIPGGPAAKSKQFNENDRIVAVAQGGKSPVDVVDMELEKVVQLIRGPKGTEVQLTISPAEDRAARRVVTLVRDQIKLEDSEAKAQLIEMPDSHGGTNRIGVIDVPSFYAPIGSDAQSFISTDVAKLVKKLKQEKVSGIIIDLRTNPGGSLEEAIKFTGLFIKDGPVVLARDSDGKVTVDSDTDSDQLYDGPLVVLINRFSASAAEIAAAALQDYGRALVVGDTSTHGKGTVQQIFPLRTIVWPTATATNDPGQIKITIRKFYRVSGASTQLKGVVPDIILPDIWSYSDQVGETSLDNPLPWDTIAAVDYDKLNLVEPYLATLRQHSDERIATNQDFAYIRQDIEQLQKLQADKTATLNEREALKERQTNQAQQDARDAERAARKMPDEKIYDITIENADEPGLPEPLKLAFNAGTKNTNFVLNGLSLSESNHISSVIAALSQTNTANGNMSNLTNMDLPKASTASASSTNLTTTSTVEPDPTLLETEHILEDYISLLQKNNALIANH